MTSGTDMKSDSGHLDCPHCGTALVPGAAGPFCPKCTRERPSQIPTQPAGPGDEALAREAVAAFLPDLELLELVGRGGMGLVFKARQRRLDRFVAVKLLPDRLSRDARFKERFNREGRVLAKLNHPNIVTIHDFGQAGDLYYYLVMEYVEGFNMRQAIRSGTLTPSRALSIIPRICEAIGYAHQEGVLHRDIKPENILLGRKGEVKIADFGIAKLLGDDSRGTGLTDTNACLGTLHYMAPEQLDRPSDVDQRADVFSLGVLLYEMLTGELPIGRFAPPSTKTPLDARIDEIVLRALQRDRELRQRSVRELKTAIEKVTAGSMPIGGFGIGERLPGWGWAIGGLAAVLMVSFALVTWFGWKERRPSEPARPTPLTAAEKGVGAVELLGTPYQVVQSTEVDHVETNSWIQFTFTSVEILEAVGKRWLSFDYAEHKQGSCESTTRIEAKLAGFEPQTRRTGSVSEAGGAEQVRHNRVQFLLPPGLSRPVLERIRDELERKKPGPIRVDAGQEITLFRIQLNEDGMLGGWLGARSPAQYLAAQEPLLKHLRQRLTEARERVAKGLADPIELAKAERNLAMVEAGNDEVAVARAQLQFAQATLLEARKQSDGKATRNAELQVARAEHALAFAQSGGEQTAAARATVQFADTALQIARRYRDQGIVSAADVLRAEADYVQADAELKRLLRSQ